MKTIKVKDWLGIPENYSGIVEYEHGTVEYRLNKKHHRLDGPAIIWKYGYKKYYINGKYICDTSMVNYEYKFYNSKEYKQAILLENMKLIKNIT